MRGRDHALDGPEAVRRKDRLSWAVEANYDPEAIRSNTFPLEWPPRSGRFREVPEIDRAAWFDITTAREKIHKGQVGFLDELQDSLAMAHGGTGAREREP